MTDPVTPADLAPATDATPEQLALFDAPTTSPAPSDSAGSTDAVTIADTAAELDTSVPADATEQAPPVVDTPDYTGICRGGPYDGRTVPCRYPSGFVLYDKQRRRMWTYGVDADRPGEFLARSGGAATVVTDMTKLREAAEGVQLDVIAYDEGPGVR